MWSYEQGQEYCPEDHFAGLGFSVNGSVYRLYININININIDINIDINININIYIYIYIHTLVLQHICLVTPGYQGNKYIPSLLY